jgi:hypothetical protein
MHFFRSEEHLRKWDGFNEKTKGGIIALSNLMWLFSGPYFTKRRELDYVSQMGDYLTDLIASLDSLDNAGTYWCMRRWEKLGFSLGRKLGLL